MKIFVTGDGNNLIDILGCLDAMKTVSKTVVWMSAGPASLIVFLRSLGMNFTQIRDNLLNLECLPGLVYGGNIEPSNTTKDEIVGWMNDILDSSLLFSTETSLKNVYKMTKLYPSFITSEGVLDPTHDVSLVDATLASMCTLGVFEDHTIDGTGYRNPLLYDVFPTHTQTKVTVKDTLFITNYSKSLPTPLVSIFDSIERKLAQDYFERLLTTVKQSKHKVLLVNSVFSKDTLTSYEISKRFENGKNHAQMFLSNESTLDYMDIILFNIRTQS
jgi:hypothetical protein